MMISELLRAPVVHIGAGSLGRGLVVPVLVANGATVTLVDADAALIDRLATEHAYPLIVGGRTETVAIAGARHVDDSALAGILAEARLVTTSVRQPNLPRVAELLAWGWAAARPVGRIVVGCENMHHVGAEIAILLRASGVDMSRVTAPDCVVDRVCAARWPRDLAVETESYLEWSIEGDAFAGIRYAEALPDVAPRFTRKRYLVNTFADAMGFLGQRSGYVMLHQAASDIPLLHRIEPLMAALRLLLHRRDGFAADALIDYQQTARVRLGNDQIDRRLTTVARDLRRKMAPGERFMEPIVALISLDEDVGPALDVVAAILDDPGADRAATLAELGHDWHGTTWGRSVLDHIASAWAR